VPGFKVLREWSDLSYTIVRDLPVVDGIQPPGNARLFSDRVTGK
jgi:hypothetical protein